MLVKNEVVTDYDHELHYVLLTNSLVRIELILRVDDRVLIDEIKVHGSDCCITFC